jgi:hypothetical protein
MRYKSRFGKGTDFPVSHARIRGFTKNRILRCMVSYKAGYSALRFTLFCLLVMAICLQAGVSASESDRKLSRTPTEYEVKAAYLYYFAKFVEWPNSFFPAADSPIVIGILGEDPFGSALEEAVNGKTVQNRRIAIRRLHTLESVRSCHILFLSFIEPNRYLQVFEQLNNSHVLTVCEYGAKEQESCMINFVLEGGRVQFDVDVEKAHNAGLQLSSKLMMVARVLHNDPSRK